MLRRGTLKGLNLINPKGGQISPNSWEGLKEKWKNPQKKAEKKQTSLKINNIIPILIPSTIRRLYSPIEDSRETSFHHTRERKNKKLRENKNLIKFPNLNQTIKDKTRLKPIIPQKIGQGDIFTKWIILIILKYFS